MPKYVKMPKYQPRTERIPPKERVKRSRQQEKDNLKQVAEDHAVLPRFIRHMPPSQQIHP